MSTEVQSVHRAPIVKILSQVEGKEDLPRPVVGMYSSIAKAISSTMSGSIFGSARGSFSLKIPTW